MLCSSICPITRCSCHSGTRMAMRRSGAFSSSSSAGQGNFSRLGHRKTQQTNKSSSPLRRIQQASGSRHTATERSNHAVSCPMSIVIEEVVRRNRPTTSSITIDIGQLTAWLDRSVAVCLLPLACWILLSGLDDLFVCCVFLWPSREKFPWPADDELEKAPERRIAILVPLWHEHRVIGQMLEHNIPVIGYKNYEVFVGVYP